MIEHRKINWMQWLFILGFIVSLGIVVIFATRAFHRAPRRHVDEPIAPWMSIPYIARSYRVPAYVLYQALGLPASPPDHRPLMMIARHQKRTVASLITALQEAIRHSRPPNPTPLPFPPGATPPPETVPEGPS